MNAAGQHLEADATPGQIVNSVNQMAEVTPKSVEFPHYQREFPAWETSASWDRDTQGRHQ